MSNTVLRLLVLDRVGPGPARMILDLQGTEEPVNHKLRGQAAGRPVEVVSSPPWFSSGHSAEVRREQIRSFLARSSPGPHVFLLCVPVHRPMDGEDRALDVLSGLFGSASVSQHAMVLFTHTEELDEDEPLDQYLRTWRKDLRELVERCGGRYHTLEGRGLGEEGGAVEVLMEKVERMVMESETPHVTSRLYQEVELRVRERQVEELRRRKGAELPDSPEEEEEFTEEEMASVRDEAELSVHLPDPDLDLEDLFPAAASPPAPPSFLRLLWARLSSWLNWLPGVVRREALLGALVGLFVGGPFGGMLGATLGSVATEVRRRQTLKNK